MPGFRAMELQKLPAMGACFFPIAVIVGKYQKEWVPLSNKGRYSENTDLKGTRVALTRDFVKFVPFGHRLRG